MSEGVGGFQQKGRGRRNGPALPTLDGGTEEKTKARAFFSF